MKVILSASAEKQFKNLPKTSQIILAKRIRQLEKDTFIQVERLSGYKNVFRTRVGSYRIVYKKFSDRIFIILVGHRKEIYKLLRDLLS